MEIMQPSIANTKDGLEKWNIHLVLLTFRKRLLLRVMPIEREISRSNQLAQTTSKSVKDLLGKGRHNSYHTLVLIG